VREALLGLLACPRCRSGGMVLTIHARDAREIREGELVCRSCGTRIPIHKGIVQALADPPAQVAVEADGWVKLLDVPEKQHEFRDEWILSLPFLRAELSPDQDSVRVWNQMGRHFFESLDRFDWRGQRVLEIGAGRCWAVAELARRGAEAVGLDILSYKYLGLVTADVWFAAHPDLYFERVIGDMHKLPFQPGVLDFVIATASMHHTDRLPLALKEAARALKDGGRALFVNEPVILMARSRPDISRTPEAQHGIVESRPTYDEWLAAFESAGLGIEGVRFADGMHITLKKGVPHGWLRRFRWLRLAEAWFWTLVDAIRVRLGSG